MPENGPNPTETHSVAACRSPKKVFSEFREKLTDENDLMWRIRKRAKTVKKARKLGPKRPRTARIRHKSAVRLPSDSEKSFSEFRKKLTDGNDLMWRIRKRAKTVKKARKLGPKRPKHGESDGIPSTGCRRHPKKVFADFSEK